MQPYLPLDFDVVQHLEPFNLKKKKIVTEQC